MNLARINPKSWRSKRIKTPRELTPQEEKELMEAMKILQSWLAEKGWSVEEYVDEGEHDANSRN